LLLSLNGKTSQKKTTTTTICSRLKTFKQEIMRVMPDFIAFSLALKLLHSQKYFQPKIGRKIRIFSLGWKNNIPIYKEECIP